MNIAEILAWFKSVLKEWIIVVTTGLLAAITWLWGIGIFSRLPSRPPLWAAWVVLITGLGTAFFRSWQKEHRRAEALQLESDEIYADVVLSHLKEKIITKGTFKMRDVQETLDLSEDITMRAFAVLNAKEFIEHSPQGHWEFSGEKAFFSSPRFKKI